MDQAEIRASPGAVCLNRMLSIKALPLLMLNWFLNPVWCSGTSGSTVPEPTFVGVMKWSLEGHKGRHFRLDGFVNSS